MRRFLAFAMCVSGFTLAVSWARADEPAAAPTDDGATSSEVATPSVRPEIVRTEPGEYRREAGEQAEDNDRRSVEGRAADQEGDSLRSEAHVLIQEYREATADYLQKQLEQLREHASQLNEQFAGRALEQAQASIETRIARFEELQQHVADIRKEGAAQEIERMEHHLNDLYAHVEILQSSAGEQVEAMRQAVERQIDAAERALAERRERRDAVPDRPRREVRDDAAPQDWDSVTRELHEKIRHLSAALEHLQAAGFEDLARETERRVQELTAAHQAARRHAAEAREQRDESVDPQPVHRVIEDLTNQVGELRRELRRLHREVDELRRQHRGTDEAPSDRDAET